MVLITTVFALTCVAAGVRAAAFTPFPGSNLLFVTDVQLQLRGASTRDSRYLLWPNPAGIPYRLDPTYSAAEQTVITSALNQIGTDMGGCIRFIPYTTATAGQDHLAIFKTLNDGTTPVSCFSFPGRYASQAGQGQKVAMFSGTNGCLGSQRDAMKFFVHALGLRNEYNRPDRDQYIQVTAQNVRPELASSRIMTVYTPRQVDYLNTLFDYKSITIPSPTKYARDGTTLFTSLQPAQTFGNLPRLSLGDCQALSLLYTTCRVAACADPYGGAVTVSPVSTAGAFNTAATVVTIIGGFTVTATGTAPTVFSGTTGAPLEPNIPGLI